MPTFAYWIGVVVVAFVLGGILGDRHRAKLDAGEQAEALAISLEHARNQEAMWQGIVNETARGYDEKVRNIRGQLDSALARLRQRPERPALPATPDITCPCGTGAFLCREDGEFLVREAARADEFRAGLEACYKVIDLQ